MENASPFHSTPRNRNRAKNVLRNKMENGNNTDDNGRNHSAPHHTHRLPLNTYMILISITFARLRARSHMPVFTHYTIWCSEWVYFYTSLSVRFLYIWIECVRGLIRMNNICIDSVEIACGIIFSFSLSPMESIRWAHTFIIILHLLFHPLYLLGIVSEISTHIHIKAGMCGANERARANRLTVRRYDNKTNGYKAHTCFNFLFLQKFFSLLLFFFTLSNSLVHSFSLLFHLFDSTYVFLHLCLVCLLFSLSLGWYRLFGALLYSPNACLCHFILCLHLGSEHRIPKVMPLTEVRVCTVLCKGKKKI